MNLLVCCKIVPDLDRLSLGDWVIQGQGQIDTDYVRNMINPFDESALEMALRLSDGPGLTALTIGGRMADPFLKTLLALRFERAVRIETPADRRFCPDWIAALIAAFVARSPQDVLILGRQSGEGDNAKTPLLVAELLKRPCITEVLRIEAAAEYLRVTSQVDAGLLVQVVRPPLVLSVGNAAGTALRVPTLKQRMLSGKQRIEVIDADSFGLEAVRASAGQDYVLDGMTLVSHRRAGRIVAGADARATARTLYAECLKQRLEAL
jgi:electron transfer flavoprotein alpha/beta subunit